MSAATPPPRPVGRPRDQEKRAALLDAAWQLFLSEGVQAVPLDRIARQAGVSRVTLYSHFADKAALFEATVEREMTRLATSQMPLLPSQSLRNGLIAFGTGLMTFLTSSGPASYYTVLAGELRRHPDLARRFYDHGPAVTMRNLAAILAKASTTGEISLRSPEQAAEQLIGLWQGVTNYQLALGLDLDRLILGIPERVESAVDVFLRAFGPT
jgi:TetR/AcrR family transcriptional regulator, mexJK operon transcriptional repressor